MQIVTFLTAILLLFLGLAVGLMVAIGFFVVLVVRSTRSAAGEPYGPGAGLHAASSTSSTNFPADLAPVASPDAGRAPRAAHQPIDDPEAPKVALRARCAVCDATRAAFGVAFRALAGRK